MMSFADFLADRLASGGFTTEDVLVSALPLMREVLDAHESGKVGPLAGLEALRVDNARIWFEDASRCEPTSNPAAIRELDKPNKGAVEVLTQQRRTINADHGEEEATHLNIAQRGGEITRPVYLPGYVSWEHEVGHHDPLADVFSLGMLLASLACGLDFNEPDDLRTFVTNRANLFAMNRALHPVLAKAINRMTELSRHRRPQDLHSVVRSLENYREQDVDIEFDLARIEGFASRDLEGKQQVILGRLQERLFEISRRNRLLNFKQTMQTVNLTHASVPLSFDVANIRPDQILTWDGSFKTNITAGRTISLNKYLNFTEVLYLPSILNRIGAEARRDKAEFGFEQLRLVLCFLRWSNVKEKPPERFTSPLILLPVELVKKKGVRDTYQIRPLTDEAEVNPVIRHQFKQLFGIDLPERIDLGETSLDKFHEFLAARIQASEPGITLAKIDRPRIDLIHDLARRKLDSYRRRARISGRGVRSFMDIDYCYDPANYHPLGLQIFSTMIRCPDTHLREIIQDRPAPRHYVVPGPTESKDGKQRQFYSLREEGSDNAYAWEFDLCSVTLGNFKYRKMTLVRDYDDLLDEPRSNQAFDATFSLVDGPDENDEPAAPEDNDRYHVVACDPTQSAAIALGQSGQSYIIQGPPGTGKSQTITNLIADYVARGKRVLFVCEKRAAIDVVYLRLKQRGLDDLCCLIHDSQTDKKEFVMDLKKTYEGLLAHPEAGARQWRRRRRRLLSLLATELGPIEKFNDAMQARPAKAGVRLRTLLDRAIALSERLPDLTPLEAERLPQYDLWAQSRGQIERLVDSLRDIQADGVLANHPLSLLNGSIVSVQRPLEQVTTHLESALGALGAIRMAMQATTLASDHWKTLADAGDIIAYAAEIKDLARDGLLALLNPASPTSTQFARLAKKAQQESGRLDRAREGTKNWREKLPPEEVGFARDQARMLAGKWLAFLSPTWWRLRKVLKHAYNFQAHVVAPPWATVLEALDAEYKAAHDVSLAEQAVRDEMHFEGNVTQLVQRVHSLRERQDQRPPAVAALNQALLTSPGAQRIVADLASNQGTVAQLAVTLNALLDGHHGRSLEQLDGDLAGIEGALAELPPFLNCLAELAQLPPELAGAFRTMTLTAAQLEAAIAQRSLAEISREDRWVHRFSGKVRRQQLRRLDAIVQRMEEVNATVVRETVREGFLDDLRIASLPAAQLSPEEKEFKKHYNRGRKELEHEFGKTMRYKSIRDLVAEESGMVVRDLKPVWLMSPLSVSDALPLDENHFDVVIFDEASQITLEEAIPAVFRAKQAIVVGDEMQLPPTNFFSANRKDDDEPLMLEDEGEMVEYDLDGKSFLSHAARNLSSRMLGWHYRSRSESLISFSNWAFYQGRLLTVPQENLGDESRGEIVANEPADGEQTVAELLARPVSFHRMAKGVYDKRRNRMEADYIAHMVRKLLTDQAGLSIGIVAFSEAQQDEIETALAHLARKDTAFRDILEAEYEREVDGQFVGLLVKNLENIQGDERDIIIMSVCYGYGLDGKMRMNFGPINQSGGEKRLNVAFSRAKHHMALVSSIQYTDIKNDYNDGANCLKNYIRYAAASSIGDNETTERVLRSMSPWEQRDSSARTHKAEPLVSQIANALEQRGYLVDLSVGMSHFRCDVAVRRAGDSVYRLGILADTGAYYGQSDLIERDLMKPKLLRAFGWTIMHVLAKDWHDDREAVLQEIEHRLAGQGPRDDDQEPFDLDAILADADALDDGSDDEPPPRRNAPSAPLGAGELFSLQEGAAYRFELSNEKSNKFWEIVWHDETFDVRYGRIGSQGQTNSKTFYDGETARRTAETTVRQKLAKGYHHVTDEALPARD